MCVALCFILFFNNKDTLAIWAGGRSRRGMINLVPLLSLNRSTPWGVISEQWAVRGEKRRPGREGFGMRN